MSQLSAICSGLAPYARPIALSSLMSPAVRFNPFAVNPLPYLRILGSALARLGSSWNFPVSSPDLNGAYAISVIPSRRAVANTPFFSILRWRRLIWTWLAASESPYEFNTALAFFMCRAEKLLTPTALIFPA